MTAIKFLTQLILKTIWLDLFQHSWNQSLFWAEIQQITYIYDKALHSHGSCTKKLLTDMDCIHFICQFHKLWSINARGCFHPAALAHAKHAGRLNCLISSLILMTTAEGTVVVLQWKIPNSSPQPAEELKIGKCVFYKSLQNTGAWY